MAADALFVGRVMSLLQQQGASIIAPIADFIVEDNGSGPRLAQLASKYTPITDAQIRAVTDVQANAALAKQQQRIAQSQVDDWDVAIRALVLALIDQLNVIRAALPTPLSPITPAQALAAIRAKAGTL